MTSVSLPRIPTLRQIKQGFSALGIGIFCIGFLAGCGERISEHGHVINQAEMDIIKIGQTTRAEIIGMLGRPSFEGAFDSRKIYYASQIMEQPVAGIAKTKSRVIYAFSFDANNSLQKIDLIDEKSSLNVTHVGSKTPTPGDTFGVVEQLFSNIKRRKATE
ncbi:outer membrane protein assembly factor BamE [Alphaproteobacteria bacterium]|nr:outer membrane protein assembly factor BamE [Alphaproteobacteria bacterium]